MAVAMTKLNLYEVPVKALQPSTKKMVSILLNTHRVLPSEDGLPRDWRGLAQLTGLHGDLTLMVANSMDPTAEVLKYWTTGTLGLLQDYLSKIDRWDVVDDTAKMMEIDAIKYQEYLQHSQTSADVLDKDLDKMLLTKDDLMRVDQGLEPQHYNAYLLYADEDEEFAIKIVEEMETNYELKLCLRDRDLLVGHTFMHEAIMKLISERCNRLIVVVSPSFLRSEANKFFVAFAQAIGIDQHSRKIIPVMYKRCTLPPELSYYFLLDYARSGPLWNFWEKLNNSIQVPKAICNRTKSSSLSLVSQEQGLYKHTSLSGSDQFTSQREGVWSDFDWKEYKEPIMPALQEVDNTGTIPNSPPTKKNSYNMGNVKLQPLKWFMDSFSWKKYRKAVKASKC